MNIEEFFFDAEGILPIELGGTGSQNIEDFLEKTGLQEQLDSKLDISSLSDELYKIELEKRDENNTSIDNLICNNLDSYINLNHIDNNSLLQETSENYEFKHGEWVDYFDYIYNNKEKFENWIFFNNSNNAYFNFDADNKTIVDMKGYKKITYEDLMTNILLKDTDKKINAIVPIYGTGAKIFWAPAHIEQKKDKSYIYFDNYDGIMSMLKENFTNSPISNWEQTGNDFLNRRYICDTDFELFYYTKKPEFFFFEKDIIFLDQINKISKQSYQISLTSFLEQYANLPYQDSNFPNDEDDEVKKTFIDNYFKNFNIFDFSSQKEYDAMCKYINLDLSNSEEQEDKEIAVNNSNNSYYCYEKTIDSQSKGATRIIFINYKKNIDNKAQLYDNENFNRLLTTSINYNGDIKYDSSLNEYKIGTGKKKSIISLNNNQYRTFSETYNFNTYNIMPQSIDNNFYFNNAVSSFNPNNLYTDRNTPLLLRYQNNRVELQGNLKIKSYDGTKLKILPLDDDLCSNTSQHFTISCCVKYNDSYQEGIANVQIKKEKKEEEEKLNEYNDFYKNNLSNSYLILNGAWFYSPNNDQEYGTYSCVKGQEIILDLNISWGI